MPNSMKTDSNLIFWEIHLFALKIMQFYKGQFVLKSNLPCLQTLKPHVGSQTTAHVNNVPPP